MTAQTQAGSATIAKLIINSPYEEPREHWRYDRETRLFTREPERRKPGYVRASEKSRAFDDPGVFTELRPRNLEALPREEVLEPVQRQVIGKLAGHDVGR